MADIYVNDFNPNKTKSTQSQNPALEGVDLSKPLTGEEVAEAIKLRTAGQLDWNPTHEDYLAYNEWNKNRHIEVMDGLMEGGAAVLGDLGNAVGAVFDHPLEATAKFAPSVLEAFIQGSRNLYGMVAQSQDPNSVLFKWKNALSHDGSSDGYNQFLEALDFNKRSGELASGKDTILVNKDYIDHDITLAASYIADPTLFIPFGTIASAGLKAAGLGEKVAMIGAKVEALKGAVIGGGLKIAGGAIEAVGGATRATMDGALKVGGNVLETATGMSSKEWQATARMSGMTGSFANMMGADIAGVSGLSGAYVASGAARGVGEAMGAVGEQILKQGGKRGFNSFAVEALKNTPNLSAHAQKLLKVLDSIDPMLSYANTIGTGMAHGAIIGGGLGYLNAGKEGFAHGMGAGIALGGVGAGLGRMYADYTGGTMYQRAEVQGTFVMENWKKTNPEKHAFGEKLLKDATEKGDRAGALQIIAGLDKVAPDARFFAGNSKDIKAFLQTKGYDIQGFKVDPKTGERIKDANGNDIQVNPEANELLHTEGGVFSMHIDKVNGKKQVTMFINTESSLNTTYHHELFHTIFKEVVMKDFFKDKLASKLLGEYENGVKLKNGEVHPNEFRAFAERYYKALHTKNKVLDKEAYNEKLKQLDSAISEWNRAKKLGKDGTMGADGNSQAGEAAKHLDYMVEEFGAYYFTQMMKGKPLDYLFRGADLGGIRGAFESVHNSFLDFFESRARKANPEGAGRFDFSEGLDKGFGEATGSGDTGRTGAGVGVTGTSTKRVRVGGIDYLMRDVIRAASSRNPSSVGGVDVRTWTPEARTAFFEGRGADGLKFQFDKNGNRLTKQEEEKLRIEHGKAIFDALNTLDPNLVKDGVISGTLSDAHIKHLVDKGLISPELGNRIKNIQRMVNDPSVSNVITHDYHGNTKELEGDVNNPKRLRGNEVPITHRESIVFGYRFSVDKEGKTVMIAESLDKQVLDFRGNKEWAKPEVRELFGDNRDAFDKAFIEYIKNANKDANDPTRVPSERLPLLEVGDGLGAKRRDIMHQVAGFVKAKGADYINAPLAEIKRNTRSTRQSLRIDLMSDVKTQSTTRFEFNDPNAFSDISRNFKPSDMESEKTPNGTVYKHPSGSSLLKSNEGLYNVYDSSNKLIGKYKTEAEASKSLEVNFNKEQVQTERNIETGKKVQEKLQGNFKVIDEATRQEAKNTGDIFSTQWGKEFTAGTQVVRQTREEFILSNMIKLRQSKPEVIRQVIEAKVAEVEKMKKRVDDIRIQYKKLYDKAGEVTPRMDALKYEAIQLQSRINKYDLLDFAVRSDRAKNANGSHILEVINNLRENGGTYMDIAKMLFGDAYNNHFETGKPVTTVATHGTNSEALLKSMQFNAKFLGEKGRHGSAHDSVGAFLSGTTQTSLQYSYGNFAKDGSNKIRMVRALVKMENPFVIDLNYRAYDQKMYNEIFTKAKDSGHDGVIIQNVYDGGGGADTVFVPFSEKLKENTAILDTVKTTEKAYENADNTIPAERPSTPRGTDKLSDVQKGSFKPSEEIKKWSVDEKTGIFHLENKPTNIKIVNASEFSDSALTAKNDSKFGTSVDVQSSESYTKGNYTLIMAGDGLAHASISADGELGSVVKGKNGTTQDVENVIKAAISTGKVKWLNGFDTILPEKYSEFGFEAVARIAFNDEYKPDGWDYNAYSKFNKGRPDVVFMSYKGDSAKPYSEVKNSIPKVESYDDASSIAKDSYKSSDTQNGSYKPVEQNKATARETQKLSDLVKGSFKVRDVVRQTGFDKFIENAKLSGRLIEGRKSTDFAGRPVVIVNYDNSGVWRLTDSKTGETIGEIDGGAMHNIISGKINPDKQPAVLASVNDSGLARIEEVRQLVLEQIKSGKLPKDTPLTFVINSGSITKSLSHPQVANSIVSHLARFLHQGVITPDDINTIIKDMSEASVTKKVGGVDTEISTGVKLKHLIDKSPQEQISFLQNEFLKQNKSTFDERSSTMDRLTVALGKLESVKNNKDYFRKFFGNENFNPSGKGFKNELLKITDDPITRNANGESIGYGKIIAVLEVPSESPIVGKKGGHTGFPIDYRSEKGKGKYNAPVMSVLDQPINIEDMLNRPSNKDIGTHYKTDKGAIRSTSELIMTTTGTFGSGVVKEGSHATVPTPENKMLKGSDIKGNYKVSEQVKKGVSDIDKTIAGITKRSVVSSGILSALDDFKEALRKQDATDEIVVKDVETTHTALINAINNEMSASSEASLPDLRVIKKKVEAVDRGLKKNQGRISENSKKAYQNDMAEGADLEAEQIKADKKSKANRLAYQEDMQNGADIEAQEAVGRQEQVARHQDDMAEGADIESEQAFDKTQERVAQHEADMAEGADIESEQAFDAREEASAEAERQSNAQAQAQAQAGNAQAQGQPQAQGQTQPPPQPKITNERESWRIYATERTPNGAIYKNGRGFSIILNGTKLRVYNPQNVLLGIYMDLEQAKRRVQREEPKKR